MGALKKRCCCCHLVGLVVGCDEGGNEVLLDEEGHEGIVPEESLVPHLPRVLGQPRVQNGLPPRRGGEKEKYDRRKRMGQVGEGRPWDWRVKKAA